MNPAVQTAAISRRRSSANLLRTVLLVIEARSPGIPSAWRVRGGALSGDGVPQRRTSRRRHLRVEHVPEFFAGLEVQDALLRNVH